VHSAYANAFEFMPRDFATGEISPPSEFFPQLDLTVQGGLLSGFAPDS